MNFIHQIEPFVTGSEIRAVTEYLHSGGWLTEFKKTAEFEQKIADFFGMKYAVVVTSGTAALYLSLLAIGIGPGDSVVVPDYTMIATPNAVRWAGAEVILCDVTRDTLCADLDKVELKENTKAMIYVAINGRSGDMDRVVDFCDSNKLNLIEDTCQAFGSKWNDKFLGTFGDVGVFSLTPHKIITTGQGGVIVTNYKELYTRLRKLKDFSRVRPGIDVHTGIGFNFKFTDLQAVVGIEQLKTIDYRIGRKKGIYTMYREELADVGFIEMPPMDLEQTVPWFVDVLLKNVSRDAFISYLKENQIGSRGFYPPIHSQAPYSDHGAAAVVSEIVPRGVWLPSSIGLGLGEIGRIGEVIRKFSSKEELK